MNFQNGGKSDCSLAGTSTGSTRVKKTAASDGAVLTGSAKELSWLLDPQGQVVNGSCYKKTHHTCLPHWGHLEVVSVKKKIADTAKLSPEMLPAEIICKHISTKFT
jgi:hypothetical protein